MMNIEKNIDCILLGSNLGSYQKLTRDVDIIGLLEAPYFIAKNCLQEDEIDIQSYSLQSPPNMSESEFYSLFSKQVQECYDNISSHFQPLNHHIYLGGDHSISFLSLLISLRKYGQNIGYVQFDSHGDLNLNETSPSKNFHGMFLRPFLDDFDIPIINSFIPQKIFSSQVLFVGDLDLDPEEKEFFHLQNIRNVQKGEFLLDPIGTEELINNFIGNFTHLHLSLDIDIFHQKLISSTTTPAHDGWEEEDVFKIFQLFLQHPHCSLDIVEFNPRRAQYHEDHSLRLVRRILEDFIMSRKKSKVLH